MKCIKRKIARVISMFLSVELLLVSVPQTLLEVKASEGIYLENQSEDWMEPESEGLGNFDVAESEDITETTEIEDITEVTETETDIIEETEQAEMEETDSETVSESNSEDDVVNFNFAGSNFTIKDRNGNTVTELTAKAGTTLDKRNWLDFNIVPDVGYTIKSVQCSDRSLSVKGFKGSSVSGKYYVILGTCTQDATIEVETVPIVDYTLNIVYPSENMDVIVENTSSNTLNESPASITVSNTNYTTLYVKAAQAGTGSSPIPKVSMKANSGGEYESCEYDGYDPDDEDVLVEAGYYRYSLGKIFEDTDIIISVEDACEVVFDWVGKPFGYIEQLVISDDGILFEDIADALMADKGDTIYFRVQHDSIGSVSVRSEPETEIKESYINEIGDYVYEITLQTSLSVYLELQPKVVPLIYNSEDVRELHICDDMYHEGGYDYENNDDVGDGFGEIDLPWSLLSEDKKLIEVYRSDEEIILHFTLADGKSIKDAYGKYFYSNDGEYTEKYNVVKEKDGSYTVQLNNIEDGLQEAVFEIEGSGSGNTDKKEVSILGIKMEGKVYDGYPAQYTGTAVVTDEAGSPISDVALTYSYSGTLANGDIYEETTEAPSRAGNYTLSFALTGLDMDTYILQKSSYDFKIEQKEVSIAAPSLVIKKGEQIPKISKLTCEVDGLLDGDTFIVSPSLRYSEENISADKKGTYDIIPYGADAGNNYNIKYINGKLKIEDEENSNELVTFSFSGDNFTIKDSKGNTVTELTAKAGTTFDKMNRLDFNIVPDIGYTIKSVKCSDGGLIVKGSSVSGSYFILGTCTQDATIEVETVPIVDYTLNIVYPSDNTDVIVENTSSNTLNGSPASITVSNKNYTTLYVKAVQAGTGSSPIPKVSMKANSGGEYESCEYDGYDPDDEDVLVEAGYYRYSLGKIFEDTDIKITVEEACEINFDWVGKPFGYIEQLVISDDGILFEGIADVLMADRGDTIYFRVQHDSIGTVAVITEPETEIKEFDIYGDGYDYAYEITPQTDLIVHLELQPKVVPLTYNNEDVLELHICDDMYHEDGYNDENDNGIGDEDDENGDMFGEIDLPWSHLSEDKKLIEVYRSDEEIILHFTLADGKNIKNAYGKYFYSDDGEYIEKYNIVKEKDGSYTVQLNNIDSGLQEAVFEIDGSSSVDTDKKEVFISGIQMESKVYDGNPATYTGMATVTDESGSLVTDVNTTYSYYGITADGIAYAETEDAPSQAGQYILTVSAENDTYSGRMTYDFDIFPKELVISAASVSIKKGESLPELSGLTCSTEGLVKEDKLVKAPQFKYSPENIDTSISGSYDIIPYGADAGSNYSIKYVNGALTVVNSADKDDTSYTDDERTDFVSVNGTIANIRAKTYDALEYEPIVKVTVTIGGRKKTLTEGADYRVIYEDNVNVGTGTVCVKGNGIYKGEIKKTFTINAKPVKKLKIITGNVTGSIDAGTMANNSMDLPVYVYDGRKLLTNGKDYKLSLKNQNDKAITLIVTAEEKSNYTGSTTAKLSIYESAEKSKLISPENVIVGGKDFGEEYEETYTGRAVKPTLEVRIGNTTLTNKDYKVAYQNNKDAGTAYVIVTGKGEYKGKAVIPFRIVPKPSELNITNVIKDKTYNGKLQKPAVTVKAGSVKLKKNKDYTVMYTENLHAGTAKVTVTGRGNYTGTTEKTFKINQQNIKKVSVKGTKKDGLSIYYGTRLLKKDKDYTLKYGAQKGKNKIEVTITAGKDSDFTGSVVKNVKIE